MDNGALAYANKAETVLTSELKLVDRVPDSASTDALTSMSSVDSFEK